MQLRIVVALAQREGIGPAAHLGHLLGRQRARRLRHARLLAVARRFVGGIRQLEPRLMPERAQRRGKRLAEVFEGVVGWGHLPQHLAAEGGDLWIAGYDGQSVLQSLCSN